MDLRAPSLNSLFDISQFRYSFNDYLEGYCGAEQVLCDCRGEGSDKKNLSVCFADPSTRAIVEMSSKDRKWEMHALSKLLSFGNTLFDKLFFDYLVIDTSPGLQYSSVNAIVAADVALIVTTLETSDLQGTRVMLRDLYKRFRKKAAVIVNKVPNDLLQSQRMEKIKHVLGSFGLLFIEGIACSCEIPLSQNPSSFACAEQNHPFSKTLERIVTQISHCQDRDFRLKPLMHLLPLQKM